MADWSLGLQCVFMCVCWVSALEQRATCVRGPLAAALTVMIFQRCRLHACMFCQCVSVCMMFSLEGKWLPHSKPPLLTHAAAPHPPHCKLMPTFYTFKIFYQVLKLFSLLRTFLSFSQNQHRWDFCLIRS